MRLVLQLIMLHARLVLALFAVTLLAMVPACEPGPARRPVEAAHGGSTSTKASGSTLAGTRFVPQVGHSAAVRTAALTSDGHYGLTSAADGTIKQWDLRSERLVRTIGRSGWSIDALTISPDGKHAFSGGTNDVELLRQIVDREGAGAVAVHAENHFPITVWDLANGKVTQTLAGHAEKVVALAISSDGRRLFSASADKTVRVWDVQKHAAVGAIPHPAALRAIAAAPDGSALLTACDDRIARLYSMPAQTLIRQVSEMPDTAMVAFSSDGRLYAAGDTRGAVKVFDAGSHAVVASIATGETKPRALAFVGPETLATAGASGGPMFWNARTGKSVRAQTSPEPALAKPGGAHAPPPNATGNLAGVAVTALVGGPDGMLVAGGEDGGVRLMDSATNRTRVTFPAQPDHVTGLSVSRGGSLAVARGHGVSLWDLGTVHRARSFDASETVRATAITSDGKHLVTSGSEGTRLWDPTSGEVVRVLASSGWPGPVAVSSDGKRFAGPSNAAGALAVWDAGGAVLADLRGAPRDAGALVFSADGNQVAAGGASGKVVVWDVASAAASPVEAVVGTGLVRALRFSSTKSLSVLGEDSMAPGNYALDTKSRKATLVGHTNLNPTVAQFSADGRYLFTGAPDGPVFVWETSSGVQVSKLEGHVRGVRALAYLADRRILAAGSDDGTVKLFSLDAMSPVTLLAAGDEWLAYSADGYFDASRTGAGLVAMVAGGTVFGVDQFAFMNNRPDVLIQRLGVGSSDVVAYFERRYHRRLARANLQDAQLTELHVPEATLVDMKQDGKSVTIKAHFADTKFALRRWNAYVNGVQLFANGGKELQGHDATVDATFELVEGTNTIEVSAINERGAESYRAQRTAEYAKRVKGELYFVGFGVSDYKDTRLNLSYAHKDALDLSRALRGTRAEFTKANTKTFVNAEVGTNALREAKAFLSNAKVDDTVVMFIAGHGVHAHDADATYYFVVHDTDVHHLAETAMTFEALEDLFHDILPRKKLLLMDTCESGDAEDAATAPADPSAREGSASRGIRSRGVVIDFRSSSSPSAPPTPPAAPEGGALRRAVVTQRDRFIFTDVTRRSGAVVFSSSQGNESSYESDEANNGFFTKALLEALTTRSADSDANGLVTKRELRAYVAGAVAKQSANRQHPTIDRDNLLQGFELSVAHEAPR